ncbi:ornithine cyclodeaminase family protein [Natrialba sp. INN-245]|uniref:ornithine cyclodeaminase family protein n=1 Tax=Natrialba sp. INN-245 TaxID=2690967 RepID=UPI0021052041|nr:ornithine cyclodeaminase family protein [Natrialba sp. INN-245]
MAPTIISEERASELLSMSTAIDRTETAFRQYATGTLVSQPRSSFDTDSGSLVFTPGENMDDSVIGTRISGKFTIGGSEQADYDVETPVKSDLVVVFDTENGELKGAVAGSRTPDVRTGALGGVAIKHLARPDSKTLGIIGTGRQARTQLEAAVAVTAFDEIRAFSRTEENRERFAREMGSELEIDIEAVDSAEAAVTGADVLVCATTSPSPVFDPDLLEEGTHVHTIGPAWKDAHELDMDVVEMADVIVTDSKEQVREYADRYFLAGTKHEEQMVELADVVLENHPGRTSSDAITLFSPMGLPGTEVILANEILNASTTV